MVEEQDFLRFGPLQEEMFASLHPLLETFSLEHCLRLSRVFDGCDTVMPHCCYFLGWDSAVLRQCFLRICAEDPFKVDARFTIGAQGRPRQQYKQWKYKVSQGPWLFESILASAYQFVLQTTEVPDGNDVAALGDDSEGQETR